MTHHVIHIGNSGLTLYRQGKHTLREVLSLAAVTARSPLHDYVAAHGVMPVIVVLDIQEESHALESIPHLSGRDRETLLERKKNQLFPRARFSHAAVRGRDKTGRRDDQVFFSAVTDEQVIQPWLALLFDLQLPVIAIQSLPVLNEKLAKDLSGGEHKFLITLTEDHRGVLLRQSYFKENILALSRFRQLKAGDLPELAATVKEEVDRSRRFVSRQFSLTQNVRIAAHFFYTNPATHRFFKTVDFSLVNLDVHGYLALDYAAGKGMATPGDTGAGPLLAVQLAKIGPVAYYRDPQSQYYYRHYRFKNALNLAGILILLAAVIHNGLGLAENARINDNIAQLRNEQQRVAGQLSRSAEAPLINHFNPFEIRTQLDVHRRIQEQIIIPAALLAPISEVLQSYPGIALTSLVWGGKDDESLAQPPAATVPAETARRWVSLRIGIGITPFDGDYRKALALIERVARQFSLTEGIKNVATVKLPIAINAGNELSGTSNQHVLDSEFILEMHWEHP